MDPLKAHPTTYASHELEDARARINRELSRRRSLQASDAAEDFPRPQSAYHRAKRDLFAALSAGGPSAHTHASAGTHAPDQPAAGPEEQGPGVDAPFQPHTVRFSWRWARMECSCQGWHWQGDLGAIALNSYAQHLRLAWGC